jgi:hypothetical protein
MDLLFIGNKNSNFFSWKKCNFSEKKEGFGEENQLGIGDASLKLNLGLLSGSKFRNKPIET